ncbi:Uncharacterised protein [Mycobacteroides abscessus subsp. abscessus]|nr:Uncharacterised protein [Mycobacteroides abscessus subsp. abscessus]
MCAAVGGLVVTKRSAIRAACAAAAGPVSLLISPQPSSPCRPPRTMGRPSAAIPLGPPVSAPNMAGSSMPNALAAISGILGRMAPAAPSGSVIWNAVTMSKQSSMMSPTTPRGMLPYMSPGSVSQQCR